MQQVTVMMVLLALLLPAAVAFAADAGPASAPAVAADAGVKADAVVQPKAPETPQEVVGLVKQIYQAFKQGKWAWAVGLVLMLVVFGVNRLFKSKIPTNVLPWLSIGLGVASNIAFSLAAGVGWLDAILGGVTLGLSASGAWSALGKYFLPKAPKEKPEEEPKPA